MNQGVVMFSTPIAGQDFAPAIFETITPWALTEYDEEGEAVIHGFREGTDCEVLFELQNLTEVGRCRFSRAGVTHRALWPRLSSARQTNQDQDSLDAT